MEKIMRKQRTAKHHKQINIIRNRIKILKYLVQNNADERLLNNFNELKMHFHPLSLELLKNDKQSLEYMLGGKDICHINISLLNRGYVDERINRLPTDGFGRRDREAMRG